MTGLENFGVYLSRLLTIDALFLNEDRHMHNIAVLRDGTGGYHYCPVFDNGCAISCFSSGARTVSVSVTIDNILSMIDLSILSKTPKEIDKLIAARIRNIRRRRKISQKRLSEKSGVSLGSVKRFESSGEISLISLTKIAIALDIENELEGLFEHVPFLSIEELINEEAEREKKLNAL